jgi:hypothetical protein
MFTAHAYVDESGDIGTRAESQDHFVFGGYIVAPSREDDVRGVLVKARERAQLEPNQVIHFQKYGHDRRVRLAEAIAVAPITIFLAVLCKRAGPAKQEWRSEHLYNWMVRLVLERTSWHFKDNSTLGTVTLAHLKGFNVEKTHQYVKHLKGLGEATEIRWGSLHVPVRFSSPGADERLQVADIIASAGGAAFQGTNLGVTEQRYLMAFEPRLWRRFGKLSPYGLKIQPPLAKKPPCTEDHTWVRDFTGF